MSYYYCYYIGYEKDGLIYPLGPYDAFGKLQPTVCKSRSFASDLHESFVKVPIEKASEELKKEFSYENWKGEQTFECKYLPIAKLPSGSFIKDGYFLIDDVESYRRDGDCFDKFYDRVDPVVYVKMMENQLKFGVRLPRKDCEGYEYTPHCAGDYTFYAYPDYNSAEYEAWAIRNEADALWSTAIHNCELVALETEG